MDTLVFQTSAIYWIGNFSVSLIIAILIASAIVGYLLFQQYFMSRKTLQKLVVDYTPVDPIHPNYIEKTLRSLREYLQNRHAPHHTTAHTAGEVESYIENTGLSSIIRELEQHEYQGTRLTIEEKTTYNKRISESI